VNTLQKGLSPLFDYNRGREGRGDTRTDIRGGGMGGVSREGYNKNPPTKDEGGGCKFNIYK
jgi:hypothetical protein